MAGPVRLLLCAALLGAAVAGAIPLFAADGGTEPAVPRITERLPKATLTEAAEALGQRFKLRIDPGPALEADPGLKTETAEINWRNASLDEAMRLLCSRFRCSCYEVDGRYVLHPAVPVRKSPAVFSQGGVTLTLGGVARTERRRSRIYPAPGGGAPQPRLEELHGDLTLSLTIDLDAEHADWDVQIERVQGRDDLGNQLTQRFPWSSFGRTFPGRRTGLSVLPLTQPEAHRLEWLQGDLILSPTKRAETLETPYPAPGETQQRALPGGGAVAVSQAQPLAPTPGEEHAGIYPPELKAPLSRPMFEVEQGPSLLRRIETPGDQEPIPPIVTGPRAVGRSGRSYPGWGGGGGGLTRDGLHLEYTSLFFADAREPLDRLIWELPNTGGELRIPFRLTNIVIPATDALPAQAYWRRIEPEEFGQEPVSGAPSPYDRKGGASLREAVRLLGRPAPRGRLRLGLSAREAAGWSPTRWVILDVGNDGAAELKDLRAGHYRLRRRFELKPEPGKGNTWDPTQSYAGQWLNSETEIEAPAVGKVDAPPLEMVVAGARPQPALATQAGPSPIPWQAREVYQTLGRASYWDGFWSMNSYELGSVDLITDLTPPAGQRSSSPFLRNVVAMDDMGTLLTAEDLEPGYVNASAQLSARLSAAHPRAKELRWVEGELFAYRGTRHVRIEAPFPAPGKSLLLLQEPDLVVAVADDTAASSPTGRSVEPDLIRTKVPEVNPAARVRLRICYRNMIGSGGGAIFQNLLPRALGRAGAEYAPRGGAGRSTLVQGWQVYALRASYPTAKVTPEKLVWNFDVQDNLQSLGSVRMEHVPLPLPKPQPNVAGQAGRDPANVGSLGIQLPVRKGLTAYRQVTVGLAVARPGGWGPVRWTPVILDDSGRGRLDDLTPGRYRVWVRIQSARPGSTPDTKPAEITILKGRATQLPPIKP